MHYSKAFLVLLLVTPALLADEAQVKKLLQNDSYKVDWGKPEQIPDSSVLEVGEGNGHGFSLNWWLFRPAEKHVAVYSISLDRNVKPYRSKFPPDTATAIVTYAELPHEDYQKLLSDIAIIRAAKLEAIELEINSFSSNDFWVNAQLFEKGKQVLNLDWAGYDGSTKPVHYAKPKAVVVLAKASLKGLKFGKHELTGTERSWLSEKFIRDYTSFENKRAIEKLHGSGIDDRWWVRDRYISLIGFVGDELVLSVLRKIIEQDSDKEKHGIYAAINAATRLTKTDLRDKPVEEMDLAEIKPRYLEMLKKKTSK